MKEKLPIGDAFGEDTSPAEQAMVDMWMQEARAAKRRHKIIDRFAYLMIWGYIAGVVLAIAVANIWPLALIVGVGVIGVSSALNIALVVAEMLINYKRLKNRSTLYEQQDNSMT